MQVLLAIKFIDFNFLKSGNFEFDIQIELICLSSRVAAFEQQVLCNWNTFTIWGAGRDGRK